MSKRVVFLGGHDRALPLIATPDGPLSTGLEKPRRIRTESSLNERLGRHESATRLLKSPA